MPLRALKPLTADDRGVFEGALGDTLGSLSPTPLSAYSFAYHYLWQDHFQFVWTRTDHHLFLFARYAGNLYMPLPPLGPFDPSAVEKGWAKMQEENRLPQASRIENIPEEWADAYSGLGFRLEAKAPEYLYLRADLESLPGDRYKSQRWACNRFERAHRPRLLPYTSDQRAGCQRLLGEWEAGRARRYEGAEYRAMLHDSHAVHCRALLEADEAGVLGRVLYTERGVAGYTFGYPLSRETFCVLLEATDLKQTGAAAYLSRALSRELAAFRWINALDDSGLENLRQAKESYRPVRKLPNYLATRSVSS